MNPREALRACRDCRYSKVAVMSEAGGNCRAAGVSLYDEKGARAWTLARGRRKARRVLRMG